MSSECPFCGFDCGGCEMQEEEVKEHLGEW